MGKDGQPVTMTAAQAAAQGLGRVPTGTDQQRSAMLDALNRETDPAVQQQMLNKLNAIQTATTPVKEGDPDEANQREFLLQQTLNELNPPPSGSMNWTTNNKPAGAAVELSPVQSQLASDYFTMGPPGIKGNAVAAAKATITQLAKQGYINLRQSRDTGVDTSAKTSIQKPSYTKSGKPLPPEDFFRVDLINPKTGHPYVNPDGSPFVDPKTGKAETEKPPTRVPMEQQPLSGTVVPSPTTATAMPPGALGPAPRGVPDGTIGTTTTGQRGVVRGGYVYPMQ